MPAIRTHSAQNHFASADGVFRQCGRQPRKQFGPGRNVLRHAAHIADEMMVRRRIRFIPHRVAERTHFVNQPRFGQRVERLAGGPLRQAGVGAQDGAVDLFRGRVARMG